MSKKRADNLVQRIFGLGEKPEIKTKKKMFQTPINSRAKKLRRGRHDLGRYVP